MEYERCNAGALQPAAVLAALRSGREIFLVEGEKDVDTLAAQGLVATTNPGGAAKWLKSYSNVLSGGRVVIIGDNDKAGAQHVDILKTALGRSCKVRVVELPGLPPHGDVTDWLATLGHTRDDLMALVDSSAELGSESPSDSPQEAETADFTAQDDLDYKTDLGNAERLVAAHGNLLRYNVDSGCWLVWDLGYWRQDDTGVVHRMAREVVRSYYDLLKLCTDSEEREALYRHATRSEAAPRLAAMVDLARFCPGIPVHATELDADPWLLSCVNGTIDLKTGGIREHRQSDLITKQIPVVYDIGAKCPRWTRFLEEVFQNDYDIIDFVRRMSGYCLTGDTREQSFFLLVGKGSNGKGVFMETIQHILGDYSQDTPVTTFLEKRDQSTADLASLVGARLVTASEGENTTSFNEKLLKRLSGGDPITCRHLYRSFFTYRPSFKIIFATNEVPRIRSQNYAMKRRVKLIPFQVKFYYAHEKKFPVRDEMLRETLKGELPGILNWMISGCRDWQSTGFHMPMKMIHEVESLFDAMDPLGEFIESQCILHPGYWVESGTLWQAYLDWCKHEERVPAFKMTCYFTRSLVQRDGIEAGRDASGRKRVIKGLGLMERGSLRLHKFDEDDEDESYTHLTPSDANRGISELSLYTPAREGFCENGQIASDGVRGIERF